MAAIGIGLLLPAHLAGVLSQAGQQMSRASCSGANCRYGLLSYLPWGPVFLGVSLALGLLALSFPRDGSRWRRLRLTAVPTQWLLLPLPALICGNP